MARPLDQPIDALPLPEGFRIRPDAGKLLQCRQHVERRGVAVRVLARGQRLGLLPAIAVHAMVDLRILGLPDLARDVLPTPVRPAVQPQPAD